MLKEFREFINKGNMIDLAVGVVLGAAFTKVVDAVVNHLISPLLGLLGGANFDNLFVTLKQGTTPGPYASLEAAKTAGAVYLGYGAFLTAFINFVIVGFALFLIVKAVNRVRASAVPAETGASDGPTETEILAEIRDELRKRPL